MKKLLCFILCAVLTIGSVLPVCAMISESSVQLVHIRKGEKYDVQITEFFATLEDAVAKAVSGDIIEVFQDITVSSQITISDGMEIVFVSGTKRKNTANFGQSVFEKTDADAAARTVKKNFSGSLFSLGENSKVTFENIILDGNGKGGAKGGLVYAENGASLTLRRNVTLKNSILPDSSFGGAVYAEKNTAVTVENTVFSNNSASVGGDIYAERKTDVTLSGGITADFAFPEEVGIDISGLNLILTGEIGLTFHTSVPDRYLDGTFSMTSHTGEPVLINIADCEKDADGRYMAKYNVSSIELSEPVTLTVYDKDGNPLAAKEKSVEDYGKALIADEKNTEKEKNVIIALLNYGHYAQLECSAYEGWEIGKDYAETAKYADLTTGDDVFYNNKCIWEKCSLEFTSFSVQLLLDYKTDIILHFPLAEKPVVLVNGEETEAGESTLADYGYCIAIKGISALDLEKEFTVTVNEQTVIRLSAMSYCGMAIEQGSMESKNAVKALYEFYMAAVNYNSI